MEFKDIQKCSGQMFLAVVIILSAVAVLFRILMYPIPPENKDLANIVIGIIIGTGFGSVVSYYFGSSIGSRNKETTLDNTIKTYVPSVPAPVVDTPPAPVAAAQGAPNAP
jgi:hypothetical protein